MHGDAGEGRQSSDEAKHKEGSEEQARPGNGLSTRTSARTGGPSTLPSNVSRTSTASRRESESGTLREWLLICCIGLDADSHVVYLACS